MHRAFGRICAGAISVAASGSFWVRGLAGDGGLNWIYILSDWTLMALACGIRSIRTGRRESHCRLMIGM